MKSLTRNLLRKSGVKFLDGRFGFVEIEVPGAAGLEAELTVLYAGWG